MAGPAPHLPGDALATLNYAPLQSSTGQVAASGHLRISARNGEELRSVRRELERVARGGRISLVRLDREQLPGALATLRLGRAGDRPAGAATGAGIVVETGRAPAWTGLARAVPGLPGAARRLDSGARTPPTPLIDDGRYEVEAVRNLAMIACI
ncbi:hypothetical protein AB0D00_31035 [Streptomyces sp. NPDC048213]|uniref:hypothetical protein n=1 Tax=Streptomyces sp. NPDC048213 TaxID=3160984 RepID=UPI0033EAAEF4